MPEKFLYAGPRDIRINDGLRVFCSNEHLDEGSLRASIKRRIQAAKHPAMPVKAASFVGPGMQGNEGRQSSL